MIARLWTPIVLLSIASGCTSSAPTGQTPPPDQPSTLAVHLAYDEPHEGCQKVTTPAGETIYMAPFADLTRADLETVRALHSERRNALQLVFNYTGRRRLQQLSRANYTERRSDYGVYGLPPQGPAPGARLAVLIDNQLICAPPIDRVISDGQILIFDVYSFRQAEDTAAALSLPEQK